MAAMAAALPLVERGRVLSSLAWAAFVMGKIPSRVLRSRVQYPNGQGIDLAEVVVRNSVGRVKQLGIAPRSLETNPQYGRLMFALAFERLQYRDHDLHCVQSLRSRMLELDNRRLTTSSTPGRRQRSILKAERRTRERLGDKWAKGITQWVRVDAQDMWEPISSNN